MTFRTLFNTLFLNSATCIEVVSKCQLAFVSYHIAVHILLCCKFSIPEVENLVRILLCFSRWDDGPRKFNWVGEDDDLKQKKQIKVKHFSFQDASFLFRRSMNMIQFIFNEYLFLKIKGFRILLDQGDQLLIGLIKSLQVSNGQDHLIVPIGVIL